MLFYSVFHTFHRKNDSSVILKSLNPEGPLGSYLCDITLPALLIMSVSFCGTKKINRIFYRVIKNLNVFLFLWSSFLVPVFFCSFLIPFMENLITFIKSIFGILLLLIVVSSHAFSRLVFFGTTLVFVSEVVHYNSNNLLILFVPGYLLTRSVVTGLVLVADNEHV